MYNRQMRRMTFRTTVITVVNFSLDVFSGNKEKLELQIMDYGKETGGTGTPKTFVVHVLKNVKHKD